MPEIAKLSLSVILKLSLLYPGSDLGAVWANLSDAGHGDGDPVPRVDIDRGHADGHGVETQSRVVREVRLGSD